MKIDSQTRPAGYLTRPRFRPGQLLEDEDLTAAVEYARAQMQLLLCAFFGGGIVCGLEVKAQEEPHCKHVTITVEPGVAVDGSGRLIHVTGRQSFKVDWECKPAQWPLWVLLCHHEECCRPREVSCWPEGDGAEGSAATRSVDSFEIRIVSGSQGGEGACGCREPQAQGDAAATQAEETPDQAAERRAAWALLACYGAGLRDPAPCGCAGACNCVLLARLEEPMQPFGQDAASRQVPDRPEMRRFIRPVPAGALLGLMRKVDKRMDALEAELQALKQRVEGLAQHPAPADNPQ